MVHRLIELSREKKTSLFEYEIMIYLYKSILLWQQIELIVFPIKMMK